jgi:hypothetical protein
VKTGVYIERELEMASHPSPPLAVGQVLEISFATFTPRITILSERELTVEVIAGDNIGFSDTVEYEAAAIRDGLVVLSWQEHIGSTIAHVLDLVSCTAYTAVTPAKGGFMRLRGRIHGGSMTAARG